MDTEHQETYITMLYIMLHSQFRKEDVYLKYSNSVS